MQITRKRRLQLSSSAPNKSSNLDGNEEECKIEKISSPPPKKKLAPSSSLPTTSEKRLEKMEMPEENGEPVEAIVRPKYSRNSRMLRNKFRPHAMFKEGELISLQKDGLKGKEMRRLQRDAKWRTTIYTNELDPARKIVPFFSGAFVFSNFYPCKFTVEEREFCCSEQFYHYCKAITFDDENVAEQLMETDNPKAMKRLGRQIEGFDETKWGPISILVMVVGLKHKFQQNPRLRQELLATEEAELIEASPFDGRWGAKKSAKKILDGEHWTGKNHLGRVLMALRTHLRSRDQTNFELPKTEDNTEPDKDKKRPAHEEEVIPQSKIHRFAGPVELALASALVREFDLCL